MRKFSVLVSFAGVMFVVPGCGNVKEAVTFNDNIVKSHKRLADAVEGFPKALEANNMAEARRAHKQCEDTLAAIKTETATWKVPASTSAKNLLDSHNRYLKIEEEAIANFGPVISIFEDKKLAPEQKGKKIMALAADLEVREKAALADLQNLQRVFAKDHNIKLINK